jgi:hypothetical protein
MFERKNKTERVFVSGSDPQRVVTALAWLQREGAARGTGLIIVPGENALEGLASIIPSERDRKRLWKGEPLTLGSVGVTVVSTSKLASSVTGQIVVALYTPAKDLARLDDLQAAAICAVPWIDDDVRVWRQTWNPADLNNAGVPAPATTALSGVVRQALKSITVGSNVSTGISHPRDKAKAVWAFRILRKAGETFDGPSVRAWAANNGWTVRGAPDLADVADAITEGKRVQALERPWKDDILDEWQKRARESSAS